MAKKFIFSLVLFVVLSAFAGAVGIDDGTTFQQWSFGTNNRGPMSPDPGSNNSYGDPQLMVNTANWSDGAWQLGELDIYIPNRNVIEGYKEITIQLTWKVAGADTFMPDQPIIGVLSNPYFKKMEMSRQSELNENGWNHSEYSIKIWPNPIEEWITIKGDIFVDAVAISTQCVPEPASMLMLGLGGISLFARRKRALKKDKDHDKTWKEGKK